MVTRYHVAGLSGRMRIGNFLDDSHLPAETAPILHRQAPSHHTTHPLAMAPTTAPTLLWGGRFTGTINWHPRPPGLPNPNLLEELG